MNGVTGRAATTKGTVTFRTVVEKGGWALAFDTSEDLGSIALVRTGDSNAPECRVVLTIDDRRQQASRLVPSLGQALATAGIEVSDLAAVVVGAGPGSFTGTRVAASTAKGLVFGSGLPLWTPSSLLGAALSPGWGEERLRAVAFDARGGRLYAAVFAVQQTGPVGSVDVVMPPHPTTIDDFIDRIRPLGPTCAGSGISRHVEAIEAMGLRHLAGPAGAPSAEGLIEALLLDPDRPANENPEDFEPEYLRGSSAQPTPTPSPPIS